MATETIMIHVVPASQASVEKALAGDASNVRSVAVEAEVNGDWAIFYAKRVDGWSVTHVPSGLCIGHAPSRLEALSVVQTIQALPCSAIFDPQTGLEWPDQRSEVQALRAVMEERDWWEPGRKWEVVRAT